MTSLFSYFRHRYDKIKGDAVHSHPKESEIRQKLKKELYEYNQVSCLLCQIYNAVFLLRIPIIVLVDCG